MASVRLEQIEVGGPAFSNGYSHLERTGATEAKLTGKWEPDRHAHIVAAIKRLGWTIVDESTPV